MTDSFAFEADEVEPVDALVNFFPIEHSAFQFLDPDTEELFVILLDFASPGLVTWKIFVFRLIMGAVVDIVMAPVFCGPAGSFLFCAWHVCCLKLLK